MEPGHGADGDMRGVVGVFGRDDALAEVGGGEVFHFAGHLQQRFGTEGVVEKIAHVRGGVLDFLGGDVGTQEPEAARLHLPPKLLGGVFPFVVERAADDRRIEIEDGHGHRAEDGRQVRGVEALSTPG